ncbi:PTS lactose/cellobiose transporter subunit IIA [Latilactobacillus sakei]|uniref:PTS lactose/cellobiose transporter subunit IIA n=1 Tax=Latilactobacillus sakei TaxID=1599 RepID=UPI003F534F51
MAQKEIDIMTIISTAGDSKAKAFMALKKVRDKDFVGARALIAQARQIGTAAHNIQTDLITAELDPDQESPEMGLLMVHAQDHFMTSQLACDLIESLIDVFEGGK